MINHYTADKSCNDDAHTPGNTAGKRPDRAVTVYSQRLREAFKDVPIVIGGIEASLRRIAHYDYWSDRVRRSILLDSRADLLLFGNAERAIVEVAHRLANGQSIADLTDIAARLYVTHHPRRQTADRLHVGGQTGRGGAAPEPLRGNGAGAVRGEPKLNRGE